jgi:hypothetical protein
MFRSGEFLPGFNHYSDCECGWCVNYGRLSRVDRTRLVADMRHRDALSVLKRNSARSISGCYVNPNARCPECGDAVYFYANEHGSRVYFDDLGPPRPKHPCTDIPREYTPRGGAPTRRTRGMMQELIAAANVASLFRNKVFGHRPPDEWTMLFVLSVGRTGDENAVTAEFLDSSGGETTRFVCRSALPILEPGDFINIRGDEISFVHKDALVPVKFQAGSTVVIPEKESEPPPVLASVVPSKDRRSPAVSKKTVEYSRNPMTESEMVHFHSDALSLGDLFNKLEPVVKTYARANTRKPVDVSLRLNTEGYRTASGALWTPRLVHFLLALMFNDFGIPKAMATPNARPSGPTTKTTSPEKTNVSMNDEDELARRLSSLGRVTMKSGSRT